MHLLQCSMNMIYSSKIDLFVHSISYGHTYVGTTQYSCTFHILWSHICMYHTILCEYFKSHGLTYVGTTKYSVYVLYPMVTHMQAPHNTRVHSISYGLTYLGTTQYSDIPYPTVSHM